MSRSIRQHLADLSGASVRGFNYGKLAGVYEGAVQARNEEDLGNEVKRELTATLHDGHLDWMKKAVAEAIENESADVSGTLPVISVFEAAQTSKSAAKQHSRDIGVLNLATHLDMKWKANKEAHLTAADVIMLKDHYSSNYPKSAAKEIIDNFTKSGYFDLPVGKLMDIAAQVRTQDDFEYYIKEAGLQTNNPYNKKARQFILALLNGEKAAQKLPYYSEDSEDEIFMEAAGGDPEKAEQIKSIAADYEQRAEAERAEGWTVEINKGIPYVAIDNPEHPDEGYYFQGDEADQLLEEVPEWINEEDYILAQLMNW